MKYFKVFICYFLCILLTVPICFAETPSDISVKNVNLNINGSIAGITNPTSNEEAVKQTTHEEVCVNNQTDEQNVQEKTSPETGDAAKPLVLISAIIMLAIIFFLNFDKKDKK